MARIIESSLKETPAASTGASFTALLASGTYAVDDLLVVILRNQSGSTTISTATTGWTVEADQAQSTNVRMAIAWKVATSTSETDPVFAGTSAGWSGYSFVVKDAPTTSPIDGSKRANMSAAKNVSSGALTVGTDNCLAIYAFGTQGGGQARFPSDDVTCVNTSRVANNDSGQVIGYRQLGAAASAPTVTGYCDTSANGQIWVLAIKNKTSGGLQPFAKSGLNELAWYGDFGSKIGTITWQTPNNFLSGSINGIAVTTASSSPSSDTDSLNWGGVTTMTATENFGSPAEKWAGAYHALAFPDMTGKLLSLEWLCAQSQSGAQFGNDGLAIGFRDGSGNYVVYQLAAKNGWVPSVWVRTTIQIGVSAAYASSGSIDWTAVTGVAYFTHRVASTGAPTGLTFKNLVLHDKATIIGGGSSQVASYVDAWRALTSCGLNLISTLQGSAQIFSTQSVQIGDGTIPTYFDASAQAFEFPLAYNAVSQKNWRVAADKVELSIYGSASDTIKIKTGADVTTQSALLTVNAASSNSGTYDFSGRAFVGWLPTFKTGIDVINASFKGCGEIDAKGCALTNCTISDTTSTDAAIAFSESGGELDGVTIDVTSAGYHLELGTAVTAVTLTDVTFTGTPTTDKVHVRKTTGTVTITISGTTSLVAGDVTTEGATVVIAAPEPTLDATVLASSRVVLYNDTTDTELDNTAPGGTAWSKTITSGASIGDTLTLHVFKEGYEEFSTSFLYSGADTTLLVSQAVHPHIASLRTELGISDYTTITEFTLDITGTVEIDADDADGNTQKTRLAIWYNGILTTENGARYLRGAITVLSTAAIRINVATLDLQLTNVSVTYGLNFTDTERRLYRSDGTPIYSATSAAGSIQNDYSGVPDTVETGVSGLTGSESAQLMALPTAATVATAVWSKELPL